MGQKNYLMRHCKFLACCHVNSLEGNWNLVPTSRQWANSSDQWNLSSNDKVVCLLHMAPHEIAPLENDSLH